MIHIVVYKTRTRDNIPYWEFLNQRFDTYVEAKMAANALVADEMDQGFDTSAMPLRVTEDQWHSLRFFNDFDVGDLLDEIRQKETISERVYGEETETEGDEEGDLYPAHYRGSKYSIPYGLRQREEARTKGESRKKADAAPHELLEDGGEAGTTSVLEKLFDTKVRPKKRA